MRLLPSRNTTVGAICMALWVSAAPVTFAEPAETPVELRFDVPFSPQGAVFGFAQREDGAMDLGTAFGIERWDGFSMQRSFALEIGSPTSQVYRIAAGPDSALWLGFGGSAAVCTETVPCPKEWQGSPGLTRIWRGRTERLPLLKDGYSNEVWALLASRDEAWAGTPDGIIHYRGQTSERIAFEVDGQPLFVTALAQAQDGTLFVGSTRGFFRMQDGRALASGIRGLVTDLWVGASGEVWIGTPDGLWRWRAGVPPAQAKLTQFGLADGLPSANVRALAGDAGGTLWAATRKGVVRYVAGKFESTRSGLPDERVVALGPDDEGGMWIASRTGDIVRAFSIPVRNVTRDDGLPFSNTMAIAVDADNLWLLGQESGERALVRVTMGSPVKVVKTVSLPPALPAQSIVSMAVLTGNRLVLATRERGLWLVSPDLSVHPIDGITDTDVRALHIEGSTLLTGGDSGVHAYLLDAQSDTSARLVSSWTKAQGLCDGTLVDLELASDRSIWVAFKEMRVARINGDRATCWDRSSGFSDRHLTTLAVESPDRIWIAGRHGLFHFAGGALDEIGEHHGLFCDNVAGLQLDVRGYLWTACEGGISQIDLRELKSHLADRSQKLAPLAFSRDSGLRSAESSLTGTPPMALDSEHRFWVATADGAVGVVGRNEFRFPRAPRIRSVKIVAADGSESRQGSFSVVRGTGLALRYDVIALTFPKALRFRITLIGADGTDSFDAPMHGDRTVDLPSLAVGEYRILASAGTSSGLWTDAKSELLIRVVPPLKERPVLWIGALATILGIVVVIQIVRRRRALLTAAVVQSERESLARDLHDSLGQWFASMAFHLDAARIQMGPQQPGSEVVARARAVLQQAHDETRRMIWQLREPDNLRVSLADGLRALGTTNDGGPVCEVTLTPGFSAGDLRTDFELLQVAREAVTNARKHARARKILLEAQRLGPRLRLRISDDGVGMQIDADSNITAGHFGLLGMQERVRRIGGELDIDSHPDGGTVIEVTVPLAVVD